MYGWSLSFLRNRVAGVHIDVQAASYSTTDYVGGTATCGISFNPTGDVFLLSDTGSTYYWMTGGNAADYSVKYDLTSGTLTTGTAGVWHNLASGYYFDVQRSTVGTKACTGTMRIRRDSDGVELDSATISLSATKEAP